MRSTSRATKQSLSHSIVPSGRHQRILLEEGLRMGKNPTMTDSAADLDDTDRLILHELQQDASMSIAEIAAKVSLSHNASWRRMKRLEDTGVITAKVAVLNPESLGLGLTVFITVKAGEHSEAWLERFAKGVRELPEVLELYRLSGDMDYLLKVCVGSIADYDRSEERRVGKE